MSAAKKKIERLSFDSAESMDLFQRYSHRMVRIQTEFVDGFCALANLGPAVTVYGSARSKEGDADYERARAVGAALAARGYDEPLLNALFADNWLRVLPDK